MVNEHMKKHSTSYAISRMQIKTILYTYGQKPEHLQHEMLVKIRNNKNSHSLLLGMQTGADTLEDGLTVSHKTKHTLSHI